MFVEWTDDGQSQIDQSCLSLIDSMLSNQYDNHLRGKKREICISENLDTRRIFSLGGNSLFMTVNHDMKWYSRNIYIPNTAGKLKSLP